MMKNKKDPESRKSSISQANTYEEIGQFWDEHSLADYWEQTQDVEFDIKLKSNPSISQEQEKQIEQNKAIIELLDKWEAEGDKQEQTETLNYLKQVLEEK